MFKFIYAAVFLILFAAKVFGFNDWSWWIVFMPIWLPLLVTGLFILIGVYSWQDEIKERKRKNKLVRKHWIDELKESNRKDLH